ncbi:filamentous hemagglutinin-like protein [Caballeronia catudaia]|uniref:Filamentous hemagglutinin-like protein n=2 Tax=Caballeronia catudaia TaxID=1777136 RepID=A0A158DBW0_9BURK|nr:filamentous hemagglutinin-like protein [Caballeronia catudaia]
MQLNSSFALSMRSARHSRLSHHPRNRARRLRLRPLTMALLLATASSGLSSIEAQAAPPLPKGGQFIAGGGSISGGEQALTINQSTSRGVIDWCSFSIGNGRTVTFNNGSGATLNRVTGGDPSVILGSLNASGSVYLINPHGVLVGPTGVIATGGRFVASTLDADNNAFMQGGALTLSGGGNGAVVNLGRIGSSGGDVFLVSRTLAANLGSIDAAQGTAELAAGSQMLLQDASGSQQVFVQTGSGGTALNAGAIRAAQINLQAADGNVYALAGNSAAIRATGTATRDGHVWLVADAGGVHVNSDVSARNANGSGGTVETRGNTLDVGGATVLAATWKLGAPTFTLDGSNAGAVSRSLNAGTSVDVETSAGDLAVNGNVQWNGAAALTLGATHNVTIAANTTIANAGSGNLTLRADSGGIDNGGSIADGGTIDWSKSTGIVTALYDMNGTYSPGTVLANTNWTAAAYSGLVTQVTAYKLVNNLNDLQNVALNVSANYALGKDIDASAATSFNPIGSLPGPVATLSDAPFTGQFDGMGHTINSLRINGVAFGPIDIGRGGPTSALGLFGVVGANGVVRNVNLTNAAIGVGSDVGSFGLLAGVNYGLVTYASSSGKVTDYIIYGGGPDGGLVGSNYGTIERSSSSASVLTQGIAGGLVGDNYGTISQSFVAGSVGRGSHGGTGGIVGINAGLLTQSYSTGYAQDAGLVYDNTATGIIDQSFAANLVSGPGEPGSFHGGTAFYNYGAIHNNVYWDRTVTTQTSAFTIGNGTAPPDSNGLTTTQMSNASNFLDWSIPAGGVWAMPAGATHPLLQWQQGH